MKYWVGDSVDVPFQQFWDVGCIDKLSAAGKTRSPYIKSSFDSRIEMGKCVAAMKKKFLSQFGEEAYTKSFHVAVIYFFVCLDVAVLTFYQVEPSVPEHQKDLDLLAGMAISGIVLVAAACPPHQSKDTGCVKLCVRYPAHFGCEWPILRSFPNCSPYESVLKQLEAHPDEPGNR
jgi:hypothetical protein